MRSRSWAVTVTRLLLPEVVNFSNKKSRQGKRSALNSQWFCFSTSHSSFASLSADDGCTDGMRFLHMLSIPSGSSVRRWQRKQTWVWASPTAWLGRWGRHVYRHQWEWGKRKNIPEVVNFDLCPNLKQFKSGKFGFKTFQFIPLKRWYPRKEAGKIKVPVSMLAEHASCCSGKTSASMTTTPEFPRTPVGRCHPLPSGPHAFTFMQYSISSAIPLHPSTHWESWHGDAADPSDPTASWFVHTSATNPQSWFQSKLYLHEDGTSDTVHKRELSSHSPALDLILDSASHHLGTFLSQVFLWVLLHLACEVR